MRKWRRFERTAAVTLFGVWSATGARADGVTGPIAFSIPTVDGKATLTGELALPGGEACGARKERLPAILLVQGSGEFDREVDFGTSGTDRDLLFRRLTWALLPRGLAVVRFDYRGIHCNRFSLSKGSATSREELLSACVDPEVRKTATPEAMRSDLKQVFDYAAARECLDPKRLVMLAHSEGTFHVAELLRRKAIAPVALVLMGGVAESPKSLVRWQATERALTRIMRSASAPDRITNAEIRASGAPESETTKKGFWTREELRERLAREYEESARRALSEQDGALHKGFWPMQWWKMWWGDDSRVIDALTGFAGPIVAHGGAEDTQVPQQRQFDLFGGEGSRFAVPPRLILHPGLGHSLGRDPLMGPIDPQALERLADDAARVVGLKPGEVLPALSREELSEKPYMGFNFAISEPLPRDTGDTGDTRYRSEFGLKVLSVVPGLPAWEAGIRPGDVLLAMDGEEIGAAAKDDALARFIRRVQGLKPGGDALIRYLRWKPAVEARQEGKAIPAPEPGTTLEAAALGTEAGKPLEMRAGREPSVHEAKVKVRMPRKLDLSGKETGVVTPMERLSERVFARYQRERALSDLKLRISNTTTRPDPFRLASINSIQRNPFSIQQAGRRLVSAVRPHMGDRLPALSFLTESLNLLQPGGAAGLEKMDSLRTGLTPEEHLSQIHALLADVDKLWREAFQGLKPEEVTFLRDHAPGLGTKLEEWNYVYADKDSRRLERNSQVLALASKVDLAPLLRATASLSRLGDPVYLQALKRDLGRAGKDLAAPEVLASTTPFGKILIAGTGDDPHTELAAKEIAVLIDLAGNDYYADRVATSTAKVHASVVVDLEGDDAYESNHDFAQGSGYLGVGLLVDLAGDDTYTGVRGAQGTGFAGVGILIEGGGRDLYRVHSLSQGCGFFGVGGLLDLTGGDRYEARLLSQGVGVAGGIGGLIDLTGDDRYYAKGFLPSGYGTPGTYEGWSQGVGVGVRFLASGGIGLLVDGGGRDVMEGGDFSQGGGYYYGWGLLHAAGKDDDRYIGSRYSQGFAAHSALGTFLEDGGDDTYATRGQVATGNANDLSVAWFEDLEGNDRYEARSFSLGASANNSISFFVDHGGDDRFTGTLLPANGQANDYHGGQSLSLFLASGPGRRRFDTAPRTPVEAREGYAFLFQGGKSAGSWSEDKELERKLPALIGVK